MTWWGCLVKQGGESYHFFWGETRRDPRESQRSGKRTSILPIRSREHLQHLPSRGALQVMRKQLKESVLCVLILVA